MMCFLGNVKRILDIANMASLGKQSIIWPIIVTYKMCFLGDMNGISDDEHTFKD
jgi:hypothetical protein